MLVQYSQNFSQFAPVVLHDVSSGSQHDSLFLGPAEHAQLPLRHKKWWSHVLVLELLVDEGLGLGPPGWPVDGCLVVSGPVPPLPVSELPQAKAKSAKARTNEDLQIMKASPEGFSTREWRVPPEDARARRLSQKKISLRRARGAG
jgi:hypothetical protein